MGMGKMAGRVVFITGGGTGIGAASAELLAREGGKVVIFGRREEPLKGTVDRIKASGGEASYVAGDVSVLNDVQKAIEYSEKTYGPVDALVNNAGVAKITEDPVQMTDAEWEEIIHINLMGVFHTVKFVLGSLVAGHKPGTIVNIASISAHRGSPGYATYSASKAGVIAYTRVVAMQYAKDRIRVNSISPGMVLTDMTKVGRNLTPEVVKELHEINPLGRMGKPEDVAKMVLFLSSEDSEWITGQDFVVDGGLIALG